MEGKPDVASQQARRPTQNTNTKDQRQKTKDTTHKPDSKGKRLPAKATIMTVRAD
jgi:hypothetical protein